MANNEIEICHLVDVSQPADEKVMLKVKMMENIWNLAEN